MVNFTCKFPFRDIWKMLVLGMDFIFAHFVYKEVSRKFG